MLPAGVSSSKYLNKFNNKHPYNSEWVWMLSQDKHVHTKMVRYLLRLLFRFQQSANKPTNRLSKVSNLWEKVRVGILLSYKTCVKSLANIKLECPYDLKT